MITLPKSIVARSNDIVSYKATSLKTKRAMDFHHAACYNQHMSQLPNLELECVPAGQCILPEDTYLKWMNYCTSYGLVPLDSHAWSDKGRNCLRISGLNECRHRIYAGLCCYRWADSLAPLCYTVVGLLEDNPRLEFHQALHYGMGKFVTQYGHSFSSVCASNVCMYRVGVQKAARLEIAYGLATSLFFRRGENGTSPADKGVGMTNVALDSYFSLLSLSFPVKAIEELLEERWAPLYALDDPKAAKAVYEKACR